MSARCLHIRSRPQHMPAHLEKRRCRLGSHAFGSKVCSLVSQTPSTRPTRPSTPSTCPATASASRRPTPTRHARACPLPRSRAACPHDKPTPHPLSYTTTITTRPGAHLDAPSAMPIRVRPPPPQSHPRVRALTPGYLPALFRRRSLLTTTRTRAASRAPPTCSRPRRPASTRT